MALSASGRPPAGALPEVRTANGAVRGTLESGVAVFRGIPYAAPPVGSRRFAAPQPAARWDGVRPATAYGPPPPQTDVLTEGVADGTTDVGAADGGAADGDWLTVNVWSPDPGPAARRPVMVWIYGGGYVVGASSQPEYDGGRFARDGGVVVVTFNYRLGVEGFAHLEGAPANRGLLDQVAALEWVRDNIVAFGGDPDQVTVFGESAGAGCVAALLAMPRGAGLFRRAVVQSMPGTYFSPPLATDIAAACAGELGLRPTVADLAAVDPALLALAGDTVAGSTADHPDRVARWGRPALRSILFAPVVDGEVLPTTPWQALAAGTSRDVDLLSGHTRDEHRLFGLMSGLLGQVTPDQAQAALQDFAPAPEGDRRYRAAYPDAGPDELYELVHSDWLFRMPTLRLAQEHVAGGGRAHLYELTWTAPGMGGVLGACHGLDVPLVLGNLTSGRPALLIGDGPPAEAVQLSAGMRAAWTAFAATGEPGWPAYEPTGRSTQVFDTRSAVTTYPEERSRLIWQDHSFLPLPLESGPRDAGPAPARSVPPGNP